MPKAPKTTIEQWLVLRVVVESGGFAQAAERLNRSQSSVSYTVHRLQERLGVSLLKIEGRKAQLTDVGRSMLADVSPLIDELAKLEDHGRDTCSSGPARLRLMVDSLFPKRRLFGALRAFQLQYPEARIELRETVRQAIPDPAVDPFDLAIASWAEAHPGAQRLGDVELLAVASPLHPLHAAGDGSTSKALARHRVVSIESHWPAERDATQPAARLQWHVNTLESAIEAVRSGLCYGWLPRHLIEAHLASGELKPLPLESQASRWIPLTLAFADKEHGGPVARAMAALLADAPAEALVPRLRSA